VSLTHVECYQESNPDYKSGELTTTLSRLIVTYWNSCRKVTVLLGHSQIEGVHTLTKCICQCTEQGQVASVNVQTEG